MRRSRAGIDQAVGRRAEFGLAGPQVVECLVSGQGMAGRSAQTSHGVFTGRTSLGPFIAVGCQLAQASVNAPALSEHHWANVLAGLPVICGTVDTTVYPICGVLP